MLETHSLLNWLHPPSDFRPRDIGYIELVSVSAASMLVASRINLQTSTLYSIDVEINENKQSRLNSTLLER